MMIYVTVVIVVLILFRFLGLNIWHKEVLRLNPGHPSKLSKSNFPIGSGICTARKKDRHIWQYSDYLDGIPYRRTCSYCGHTETKLMTSNKWHK